MGKIKHLKLSILIRIFIGMWIEMRELIIKTIVYLFLFKTQKEIVRDLFESLKLVPYLLHPKTLPLPSSQWEVFSNV